MIACSTGLWPGTTQWDAGISWHLDLIEAADELPWTVEQVRDEFLRGANGTAEDVQILRCMKAAIKMAERYTKRAIMPQSWAQVMSGFPSGGIELQKSPLISITSIVYADGDGVAQTLDASPSVYQVVAGQGPNPKRAVVWPAVNASWPTAQSGNGEALTITFRAGYVNIGSPEGADVPEDLLQGILLMIGEFYKQRSESVIGTGATVSPAVVRAKELWQPYRVY